MHNACYIHSVSDAIAAAYGLPAAMAAGVYITRGAIVHPICARITYAT